ncbi:MAG: response regulator [Planctomycetales bacterium]|nr:response regulator [Planctomycetales bacterium]
MTTILIAEDHDDIRQLLAIQLSQHGFVVKTASNGREALDMARASPPDAVLMDMNMPVLDGWEASCQLKLDQELSRIPIIALTAYALPGDQARAQHAGCDAYHAKPLDIKLLVQQIESLLQVER